MNERIKELAEEAGMRHPVMGEVSYAMFDYERFAELIMQEFFGQRKQGRGDEISHTPQPLTDEQIDSAIQKQAEDLLDYIYENGTACEGVTARIRAVVRAAIAKAKGKTE